MTLIDQKAFDAVLSMAQKLLIVNSGEAGTAITPTMIEQQLDMLATIMPAQMAVIDRDALVEELIRRASQRVGTNATLKDTGDHIDWLNADRKSLLQFVPNTDFAGGDQRQAPGSLVRPHGILGHSGLSRSVSEHVNRTMQITRRDFGDLVERQQHVVHGAGMDQLVSASHRDR